MIHSTKGLSAVVTTLIIILLSLVAIGIIWVVVSNVLEGGAETTEINAKCLQVDIKATAVSCNNTSPAGNWECNVTYNRKSGGEAVDGVLIVLNNGLESTSEDVPGDVSLGIRTEFVNTTMLAGDAKPNSVEIAAYFTDSSGENQACPAGSAFEFS